MSGSSLAAQRGNAIAKGADYQPTVDVILLDIEVFWNNIVILIKETA